MKKLNDIIEKRQLPEIMRMDNGKAITNEKDFLVRREEIKRILSSYEYGIFPASGGSFSQSMAQLAVLLKPVFCIPLRLLLRACLTTTKAGFSSARCISTINPVFNFMANVLRTI